MIIYLKVYTRPIFALSVELTDKIEDVKAMFHYRSGIAPDEQRYIYAGRQLEDGNTLEDYAIPNGAVIKVIVRSNPPPAWEQPFSRPDWEGRMRAPTTGPPDRETSMVIFVKKLTGEYFSLNVAPTDTVKDLKNMVQDLYGTPPDQQRFVFAGWQLEDENTLQHYSIENDSTVHLIGRLRG
jgi:ubiquitin C